MSSYRYRLETYKGNGTRYHCPECRQKSFVRYLDTQTGEHISPKVGRCNRESKCGYHYSPKQYFADNDYRLPSKTTHVIPNGMRTVSSPSYVIPSLSRNLLNSGSTLSEEMSRSTRNDGFGQDDVFARHGEKGPSYIPTQAFSSSLRSYSDNHFVRYLHTLFDVDTVNKLIATYHIGTSKHWKRATIFWQIDSSNNVRTGKVMLYNPTTGKRVKEPYNHITWAHKLLNQPDFSLKQCLFGEHLLKNSNKPVAIVESEKTAIVASVYQPKYVWLAVGSLSNLTVEKCSVLKGRKVVLYPDLNGFEKWKEKLRGLRSIGSFGIANVLEEVATDEERMQGLDIADFFVQYSVNEFAAVDKRTKTKEQGQGIAATDDFDDSVWPAPPSLSIGEERPPLGVRGLEDWSDEIAEVEAFFKGIGKIDEPIRLNSYSTIIDVQRFIEGNLATVKANNGKPCFKVYLDHLRELRRYLERVGLVAK